MSRFGPQEFERGNPFGAQPSRSERAVPELHAILQSMAQPLIVFNANGSVRLMNAAARALHDLPEAARALHQRDFLDSFDALDGDGVPLPPAQRPTLRALRGEALKDLEITARNRRTGRSWQGIYTATPVCDERGSVQYAVIAIQDITERRIAEDALRRAHDTFRHLVENSPFGVYVVNADFRLQVASAGAQNVFQNVRPLIGRDFEEVLRLLWAQPFADDAIARFRHTLTTGQPYRSPGTIERRRDTGSVDSYDWKIERLILPDGRPGVVCHFYDLSERQQYEADLRDADRKKNEFLAMLAHELRNPLAPIRTSMGLIRARNVSDPAVERCREIVDRQLTQMARLLDDLLDVSRLASGKLTLQRARVMLSDIIAAAIEVSQPLIEQRNQVLAVEQADAQLVLDADAARLTQVFGNLLNNASKYSEMNARIELVSALDGNEAVVRVRDRGIGIASEMLEEVFELFTQSNSAREHAQGGLGIGLSLARRLVDMHGGSIGVKSDGLGHGTEFSVRLPILSSDARSDASDSPAAAPALSSLRILVVDDNADAADSIAMLLGQLGCDVRVAYRGASALEEAQRFSPELVLLDIGMPDMSGLDVCRQLRTLECGARALVVALTGWGQDDDRQRSISAGFDRHLVKPVDPDALIGLASELGGFRSPQQ